MVLLAEQRVTIDDSGKRIITTRKALRVLSQEGRREARGIEPYLVGTSKVKDLHAWLVFPSGQTRQLSKDHGATSRQWRTIFIRTCANE